MSAPNIDEMLDYWKDHPKACLWEVAEALGLDIGSVTRSFDNGLLKNYWQIRLTPDTPEKFGEGDIVKVGDDRLGIVIRDPMDEDRKGRITIRSIYGAEYPMRDVVKLVLAAPLKKS